MDHHTKPRHIAKELISQFIAGEQVDLTLPDEIAHFEEMGRAHARNMAAMVVFHARRVRQDAGYKVPKPIWPLVREYEKARGRK